MAIDVAAYLSEQQRKSSTDNAPYWSSLEELYNKKLWYQLTIKIKEFVKKIPADDLLNFYKNFIADFQQKINSLELTNICAVIASTIKDDTELLAFWDNIIEQIKICELSQALCLTEKATIHLKQNRMDKTKELLDSAECIIDKMDGVSDVHSAFYKLSSAYYTAIASYSLYYKHALLYLGCVKLEDIPVSDQIDTAFYISLAAILGDKTYNFGELLVHPILDALRNGEKQWLVDLLFAFNSGDINMYKNLKPKWTLQADLLKNEIKLERKMRLLCLMEMTFKRSSTDRHISFKDISEATDLPIEQVEMLLMRALSLGLVSGKIDEVNKCAIMTRVQPRVLTREQVAGMQKRLSTWCKDVNRVEQLVMKQAEEILT